jgi:hypothetical protein
MNHEAVTRMHVAMMIAIFLGIVGLLAVFLIPWPREPSGWVVAPPNGKAPVEVLALVITPLGALATLVGVAVTAYYTHRNFRQAQRLAQTSQFETSADLLANKALSANSSGIYIMTASARDNPVRFWQAAQYAITAYLTESTSVRHRYLRQCQRQHESWRGDGPRPAVPDPEDSPYSMIYAMNGLSQLRWIELDQPASVDLGERHIEGNDFVLDFASFTGSQFGRFKLQNVFVGKAFFLGCHCEDGHWHMLVVERLVFADSCDLSRTDLRIFDLAGVRLGEPNFSAEVIVTSDCKLDGTTVFGRPIGEVIPISANARLRD